MPHSSEFVVFQVYEDMVVEEATKAKGLSKENALKKDREQMEEKDVEPYSFENDPGSNNSGYYDLQAILTHKVCETLQRLCY
jgi:ubiquitin carboxyl-terminal hydrolase 14